MLLKTLLVLIFTGMFLSDALSADSPQDIIKKRCGGCHMVSIIYRMKKSHPEWERTVDRMVRYGVRMTQDERESIISYLSGRN
ncbi:MAG: hypothetical protein AB1390_11770 [Nitrospirota bacterium]